MCMTSLRAIDHGLAMGYGISMNAHEHAETVAEPYKGDDIRPIFDIYMNYINQLVF
jgi:hypothetical protein